MNKKELPIIKEDFIKILNKIKEYNEYIDDIYNLVGITIEKIPSLQDTTINLLDKLTNSNEWVNYFIYELELGLRWTNDCIKVTDGSPIDISTPEKLYDFLLKEYQNE